MIFGRTPLDEAVGAVLAHGLKGGEHTFKKGRVLSADDVAALAEAGIVAVVAARHEPGDVAEDEAATRVAEAVRGVNLRASAAFTGRSNLFAEIPGLVVYDPERLNVLNLIHESLTVAALAPFAVVEARHMVATIKVIPFAVATDALAAFAEVAAEGDPLLRVAPFSATEVGLVQSRLPGTREAVLDKTTGVIGRRLERLGSRLAGEERCRHEVDAVARAIALLQRGGCRMLLVSGASAITDRADVVPAAIEHAGGRVEHFGMPVDPGNLLLLGRLDGDVPVLGLPGCARSPKRNGFDWVLERLLAGLRVGADDVKRMGVGGLLTEIPSRPLQRTAAGREAAAGGAAVPRAPRIAALVLAAGQSRRMGPTNKLLAEVDGVPMVSRVVDQIIASAADPVVVVVGHEGDAVRDRLRGHRVEVVDNPDYARGLSTSLRRGLWAVPGNADGALVCLGDMPRVTTAELDRLIAAFNPGEGRAICVPTHGGQRGNPVLWARRFFEAMGRVQGDVGARHLIGENAEWVAEVEMAGDGVLIDVDTPEVLVQLASGG